MKHYIKQGLFPFLYLFFMAMTGFGITMIDDEYMWLKVILGILNVALYFIIICAVQIKEGEKAIKVRYANDIERREIIRTGEDRPLKLHEEFKPWKGFFTGFLSCVPLIILMIIHTFFIGTSYKGMGVLGGFMYLLFFEFFCLKQGSIVSLPQGYYYFSLISVPIMMLMIGFAYIIGAKRMEFQMQRIRNKQKSIYGETK